MTMINMVYLYYDNPGMLRVQIDCWNKYPGVLNELPEILLIDDGSPKYCAVNTIKKFGCALPIKVFRIQKDIPWNFSGARNLGCHQAVDWIYLSDIDTLLPASEAKKFFERQLLDKSCFYMPKRVWLPNFEPAAPAIVNLLFHKSKYFETGGYDEDFAGAYGKEDVDFYIRTKRTGTEILRNDVVIQVVPPKLVEDARTTGLSRDTSVNLQLFKQKRTCGFPRPINPLRFTWKQIL